MRNLKLERAFSNLGPTDYCVTSDETQQYNCIAWAAGRSDRWWWPDPQEFWPHGVPRENTIDAFKLAFSRMRYRVCKSSEFEMGFEKIAIYAKNGEPTHAARQLPNGKWTSKCGGFHDIEHANLECLGGYGSYEYGEVVLIMKRPVHAPKRRILRRHGRFIRRKLRRQKR